MSSAANRSRHDTVRRHSCRRRLCFGHISQDYASLRCAISERTSVLVWLKNAALQLWRKLREYERQNSVRQSGGPKLGIPKNSGAIRATGPIPNWRSFGGLAQRNTPSPNWAQRSPPSPIENGNMTEEHSASIFRTAKRVFAWRPHWTDTSDRQLNAVVPAVACIRNLQCNCGANTKAGRMNTICYR